MPTTRSKKNNGSTTTKKNEKEEVKRPRSNSTSLTEDPASEVDTGLVPFSEVQKHNTVDDCWCVISGKIYDLTDFAPEHPGGSAIVTELAGKVATDDFLHAHPVDIMTLTLGKQGLKAAYKGDVDPATLPTIVKDEHAKKQEKKKQGVSIMTLGPDEAPPLKAVLNLHDFEAIAQRVLHGSNKKEAWDYYSSGADDELTYNENVSAFQRVWLKPRILVDVKEVDTSTTILGSKCATPVYLSAVAMCGMGHADGECAWMKAAGEENAIFMVPNLNSKGFDTILNSRVSKEQPLWFQIYVNPDRDIVLDQIKACEAYGMKALCITVDSAVAGKRERDLRNKIKRQIEKDLQAEKSASGKARKAGSYANRDPALNWKDVKWFQKNTSMKIVIKGVQTGLDAVTAAKAGCHAIILSNHGGRNLDTSRSGIEILPEVMRDLRDAGLEKKIDVFVDGGIRRGTDIIKCMALGAKAVGIGKPAVYSMSAYGQEGIQRCLQILKEELEQAMRLCGVKKLSDLTPAHVNIVGLDRHSQQIPIPPSPYAYKAPAVGVRSPEYPDERSREELEAEVKALQDKLSAMEGHRNRRSCACPELPDLAVHFINLCQVMITSILKTTFAKTAGGMLHRSGLFMICFLFVHMFANLTVFFGENVFNGYANKYSKNFGVKILEYYLLATACLHVLTASYFTFNKARYIAKKPLSNGKLAITGTVLSVFLVLHLKTFRLERGFINSYESHVNLYNRQKEVFRDIKQVIFYLVAIGSVGVHLWYGWTKAVLKMDQPKKSREPFTVIGHLLIWPLLFGFAIVPVYMYLIQLPQTAKYFNLSDL
jgi:L-lactate dehydrogenase (cytochrome)